MKNYMDGQDWYKQRNRERERERETVGGKQLRDNLEVLEV